MSSISSTPLPAANPIQPNPRPHRHRRPQRGGRPNGAQQDSPEILSQEHIHRQRDGGRGGRPPRDALLALRPSSVAPSQTTSVEPSSAEVSGAEQSSARTHRAGRGRGAKSQQSRTVNGRTFGGRLTQAESDAAEAGGLQADAPHFTPGQPLIQRHPQDTVNPRKARQRRASKSTAPDIASRTHEDIEHGHYECPICTSEVLRNSKVWSCHTCWTVFHLSCVKKWSTNEGSAAAQQQSLQNGDIPPPRQWRCPGCNLPKDTIPKTYTCWCEKETEPRALSGLPPHSCGNTCGKERARKCPHPCQLTCHAGPCPPCTYMGPAQSCFCGKHENTRRCVDTDYEDGWSCAETCGDLMPCGEHTCPRPCHEGLCGACAARVDARCYCGQVEKAILCGDRLDEKTSQNKHQTADGAEVFEEWLGLFECANACSRAFDCGVHHCEKPCHSQQPDAEHCPRSPDVVSHCSCGKTLLSEIIDTPRSSCKDAIPSCNKQCTKPLPCGHTCEQICHAGQCLPCLKRVDIRCRCGRTTSTTICHQGNLEAPQCMRVCRANMSCGRHACDERCCPGERKAAERQATKKKQRPLNAAPRPAEEGYEAEHICTRMCGRPLKCGNHSCQELCHRGPCGSCREAIFDELSCDCGRTVLQPPLPCGTQPPPCRFQCERPKVCGHPQVQHNCHQNDERCPKCPFLVERRCMCGKKMLKHQQCWFQDVRCGEICGKKLKCGSHFCRRPCHRSGQCEDADGEQCHQPCGKPKKVCEHPDEAPCHAPYPCKEDKPCASKIFITCDCQAQKQEAKCNASKSSDGNIHKSLTCNDECARLERNRKLAVALNINQSAHVDGGDHVPYSDETLALFQPKPKWAQTQEREFRVFADADDEKRLRFKPMPAAQRAFIHSLAEDFGLDSESMDPEPHRHVAIFKTPRFVSAPNKTLAESARIRLKQRQLAGRGDASDSDTQKKTRSNEVGAPFNAFVVSSPRFGLTIEEVRTLLHTVIPPSSPMQFDIEFLPSDEVMLKAMSRTLSEPDLEQLLKDYKPSLTTALAGRSVGKLELCRTDASLNVARRETDAAASDGWSRVAAKGAAPKRINPATGYGGNNAFSALSGNKVTFAKKKETPKKKPVKVAVVDDWEAAELEEEEKEKGASGVNSSAEEEPAIIAEEPMVHDDGDAAQEQAVESPMVAVEPSVDAVEPAADVVTEVSAVESVPAAQSHESNADLVSTSHA